MLFHNAFWRLDYLTDWSYGGYTQGRLWLVHSIRRCQAAVNNMAADNNKRIRRANVTCTEKELLLDIVEKYKNIIENKKTDAVTSAENKCAWAAVVTDFHAVSMEVHGNKSSERK